jgi:N-acetylmuramic acid 6-phosphate (MurNAc-6-P) etherase
MIGVALTNRKLQQRGLRILAEAAGVSVADATRALRQARHSGGRHTQNGAGGDLRIPLVMLRTGANVAEARRRFRAAKGDLRAALNEKA